MSILHTKSFSFFFIPNMAFNPDIHMNPNFRFLTTPEFNSLDFHEQIDYLFEEMNFLFEVEMAVIDPNTVPNPRVDDITEEDVDPDADDKEGEEVTANSPTCKVQAGKRKRDDDFDPPVGGCQCVVPLPVILAQ
ncbi:hypothetical protein OROMI_008045 [Orobanche minor]